MNVPFTFCNKQPLKKKIRVRISSCQAACRRTSCHKLGCCGGLLVDLLLHKEQDGLLGSAVIVNVGPLIVRVRVPGPCA